MTKKRGKKILKFNNSYGVSQFRVSTMVENNLSDNFELMAQKKNISFNCRVSYYATFSIMVNTMSGVEADKEIIPMPLYDCTLSRSIINISEDIWERIIELIKNE